MNSIQDLIDLCESFKRGEFDAENFQRKLEVIFLPDSCKYTLEKKQENAHEELEFIRFSYFKEQQKQHADKVADELIAAAQAELDK